MAVIVNTNVQSLVAQRSLTTSTSNLSKNLQRLSTGYKINNAADNAAGLFISKGLESQVRGSEQCQQNIAIGINVLQTAEGDLATIQDNLLRIKDLATQAASGTNSTSARNALRDEVNQRALEITRIAKASNFNGMDLLSDSIPFGDNGLRLQVGAGSDPEANAIYVTGVFSEATASGLGLVDTAGGGTAYTTTTAANIGVGGPATDDYSFASISAAFVSAESAAAFIKVCEDVITDISTRRAAIGVFQNRLELSSSSLATSIENLSSAKSTVMDTDIASETAKYTQNQILQQVSSSMLMQANQAPSIALSLLG